MVMIFSKLITEKEVTSALIPIRVWASESPVTHTRFYSRLPPHTQTGKLDAQDRPLQTPPLDGFRCTYNLVGFGHVAIHIHVACRRGELDLRSGHISFVSLHAAYRQILSAFRACPSAILAQIQVYCTYGAYLHPLHAFIHNHLAA